MQSGSSSTFRLLVLAHTFRTLFCLIGLTTNSEVLFGDKGPATEEHDADGEEERQGPDTHKKTFGALVGVGIPNGYVGLFYAPSAWTVFEIAHRNYSNRFRGTTGVTSLVMDKFISNSFYLSGGPGYRLVAYNFEVGADYYGRAPDGFQKSKYRDLGADLAVGSRWQWGYLTFGCEWVGLYMPVLTLSHTLEDHPDAREERRQIKEDGIDLANVRFLTLQVGLAF